MNKKSIDKQVYEQYVDATVALFMEHYTAALADSVSQQEHISGVCSQEQDRRCMKAIRKECGKQRRKAIWKGTVQVLWGAAAVLVAMLSICSLLFLSVEAFRVPVINYYIEQGDGFWVITGNSAKDVPVSTAFDPADPLAGLLPEGYVLETVSGDVERILQAVYMNQNGERVEFSFAHTSTFTVDSENYTVSRECTVDGCAGIYVSKGSISQLAWVDPERNTSYMLLSNTLPETELLTIAEKIMDLFCE